MDIIPQEYQRDCLIYAFRYALGRMSTAPHTVSTAIIKAWPGLSSGDRLFICDEIRQAISDNNAGMDMDVKQWEKILKL